MAPQDLIKGFRVWGLGFRVSGGGGAGWEERGGGGRQRCG